VSARLLVLVLALGAAVVGLQAAHERAGGPLTRPTEALLYVRSPAMMTRMALSYDMLLADIYWIRAVQHYGGTRLSAGPDTRFDLLYPLLDLTTSLDPHFRVAYLFGAIFLSAPFVLAQAWMFISPGLHARERRYATLDALSAALAFAYQVSVRPAAAGRYYYTAALEISTLSDSDLDELQRFLEGDLDEVAKGKQGVGDALGRGATRFLLRLAGLPSLRLEVRSASFDIR